MNAKDLKDRLLKEYGGAPSASLKRVINRAVRQQPGGTVLMDELSTLELIVMTSPANSQARTALMTLRRVRNAMVEAVLARVGANSLDLDGGA